MVRVILVVTFALLTAACAATTEYRFVHPTTNANFERDRYECLREAAAVPQVAGPSGPRPAYSTGRTGGGVLGGMIAGMDEAAAQRAYDARVAQAEGQQSLQVKLLVMCMRNRGYELKEVGSQPVPKKEPRVGIDPGGPGGCPYGMYRESRTGQCRNP